MNNEERLRRLIAEDDERMRVLHAVRSLALPDGWIGAGFVRNAVWDALHGLAPRLPASDIDVIWHDPARCDASVDAVLEARLREIDPAPNWSVRNQARMHVRNGDAPYDSCREAMTCWPETATAVAARLSAQGTIEISAPFGVDDLWAAIIRPTPAFSTHKHPIFMERVISRQWQRHWPRLRLISGDDQAAATCV